LRVAGCDWLLVYPIIILEKGDDVTHELASAIHYHLLRKRVSINPKHFKKVGNFSRGFVLYFAEF
jgi:hypothetical protein